MLDVVQNGLAHEYRQLNVRIAKDISYTLKKAILEREHKKLEPPKG